MQPLRATHVYVIAALVFGVLCLHACILAYMGQPLIFTGGYVKLWHGIVQSAENSQHMTDWYTFSHVIHGFIFFGLLYPLRNKLSFIARLSIAMGLEMGWEVLENTDFIINRYREATIALDYYGDSVINSVCDVAAATLGFVLASRMRWFVTLSLILLMEAVVGYMIHDNLTLNVLMLAHPIDSVKAWQATVSF
jgi:Protein of unknown function (DUF2585)